MEMTGRNATEIQDQQSLLKQPRCSPTDRDATMRFALYVRDGRRGLAADSGEGFRGLFRDEPGYPGDLDHLVTDQTDLSGAATALQVGRPIRIDAARETSS